MPARDIDGHVEQRIVEASAVLPPDAAVTGWAALRWMGARWFDGMRPDGSPRPVQLASMSRDVRPQRGFTICAERLDPSERMVWEGVPVTIPIRSTTFAMRYAEGRREAVVAADMAMYSDLVSVAELRAYYWSNRRLIGNPQMLDAVGLAEENSWSPQETRSLRLVWVLDAGLPRPLSNQPVFDLEGRHVGTPDLLDAQAGVVGEYDGPLHLTGQRRGADVRREAAFRAVGLETFVVTAADAGDRDRVVSRMREAWSRALSRPVGRRHWTIEVPGWWTVTTTVAARRALDVDQQRRWLAYRAG